MAETSPECPANWGIGWHGGYRKPGGHDLYITDPTGAVVHSSRTWTVTATHLAYALMENAELKAVIGKLDRTQDGVPIVPEMPVYYPGRGGRPHFIINQPLVLAQPDGVQFDFQCGPVADYFSTPELAEAAWQEAIAAAPEPPAVTECSKDRTSQQPAPQKRKWWEFWRRK